LLSGEANVTYAEGLQVVQGDGIAVEVEEGILEHAAMPVAEASFVSPSCTSPMNESGLQRRWGNLRENKAIPVEPIWVLGVEAHELVEKDVGNGRHAPRLELALSGPGSAERPALLSRETYMGAPGWPELALKVASA
jgi:hypothetical protein